MPHHAMRTVRGFLKSDRIRALDLPQDGRLLPLARSTELAVADGTTAAVRRACADFVDLDEIEKELKKAGNAVDKAKTATAHYHTRLAGLCDGANLGKKAPAANGEVCESGLATGIS